MTPSTTHRSGAILAEKLRAAVASHAFPVAGRVTISLGVAECLPREHVEEWLKRADEALYRAKDGGRNRVVADGRGSSDEWAAMARRAILRLEWSETYECGEETIDAQHRRLFDLANTLIEASLEADRNRPALDAALRALLDHVARHFTDEEAILAAKGYARLDVHRRLHAGLLARAATLKQRADTGEIALGGIVEFLAHDVVARHMLTADREFFPLFETSATGESPRPFTEP